MSVSTHVLDAMSGRPAAGVAVTLEHRADDGWMPVTEARTDADGRIADLAGDLQPGVYRLVFGTEEYLTGRVAEVFYPEVVITVRLPGTGHTHVPLLLSPFAYSTYRGS